MKITAGINKGKTLLTSRSYDIRPALARVRKSIFDTLGDISDSLVLDLFSGAGTLGIESISRGARNCLFIDSSKVAISIIKKNLSLCGYEGVGTTRLVVLPHGLKHVRGKYSLVFVDPPFEKGLSGPTLNALDNSELLLSDAVIIARVSKREELLDHYGKIILKKGKKLGDSRVYSYVYHDGKSGKN